MLEQLFETDALVIFASTIYSQAYFVTRLEMPLNVKSIQKNYQLVNL